LTHVEVEAFIADKRSQSYPTYIYYCASDEEAEKFQSKYSISNVSSLSPEGRFVVEDSRRDYSCRQDEMRQGLNEMKEEINELKGLVMDLVRRLERQ
jgi:hypothetical protein